MVEGKKSKENKFYDWLASQIPATRLSNMYFALDEINNYCIAHKIIKVSLFETTDIEVLTKVRETVEKNKVFAFMYKKQRKTMTDAINLYVTYAKRFNVITVNSKSEHQPMHTEEEENSVFSFFDEIDKRGISFIDLRSKGGCLWIFGGDDIESFVEECKKNGIVFSFKKNGSHAPDGQPAWWTKAPYSKISLGSSSSHNELNVLLSDEIYRPLREELFRQGITTIQALEDVKLWPFMNRCSLYTIAMRQQVFNQVQNLIQSRKSRTETQEKYVLRCNETEFVGQTPAETYLHFCEDMARQYPLKFRSLIGVRISPTVPAAILKKDDTDHYLKMANPLAYIDAEMDSEKVIEAASWLYKSCTQRNSEISIQEINNESNTQTGGCSDGGDSAKTDGNTNPGTHSDAQEEKPVEVETEPQLPIPTSSQQIQIDKMEKLVFAADLEGIGFDELKDKINISMNATKELVFMARHLMDIKGKIYHEDVFIDWDEGAQALDAILDKLMEKNSGYVSAAQLYEYARADMQMFLNDNDMNDERAVYEIAQHLFEYGIYNGKRYVFIGKMHISKPAATISNSMDIYNKYADDQGGFFTLNGLIEYLNGIGLKSGNIRGQLRLYNDPFFLYYSEGVLVAAKYLHIDEAWKNQMSNALAKLFLDVGDHIILREIQDIWFDQLPTLPAGYRWTPLLLQSVLRFYGKELGAHTIIAMDTQSLETLHAMLVRNDSPVQNFGDAVISYLLENNIPDRTYEAEELRLVLSQSQMIQGNELIWHMPKALGSDERFSWDADENHVTILV